jgi:hypothetical protein
MSGAADRAVQQFGFALGTGFTQARTQRHQARELVVPQIRS